MNRVSFRLMVSMWIMFGFVVLTNISLTVGAFVISAQVREQNGGHPLLMLGQMLCLTLIIAFLVRDSLRGKPFARRILAISMLGVSWAQLRGASYGLTALVQAPSLIWLSLAATLADALLGSVAILCFADSTGARTRRNFMVGLCFIASLGTTARLLFSAARTGVQYMETATKAPSKYSLEIEKRFVAGDPTVTQDVETLLEIVRFGTTSEIRSNASMELLNNHKTDPRAVLGLQLHTIEEFRRVEEAIGKR